MDALHRDFRGVGECGSVCLADGSGGRAGRPSGALGGAAALVCRWAYRPHRSLAAGMLARVGARWLLGARVAAWIARPVVVPEELSPRTGRVHGEPGPGAGRGGWGMPSR
ncbi:hypothetical protein OHA40_30055 [Nocardia sp. NBC_00508]|uniref:hypothetical protein n=1 Tax=Nocardia sp. NBC_00508 TaxID=2975992 RepID=UPI002E8210D7|nr:hypothetical protein [Nocardia sp. NBC_00508]WUD65806.1 hypothetical protein OHA40_30055 [Nocardia sp. NBC_00508]